MEPIQPPKIIKVYSLLKMATKSGLNISTTGAAPSGSTSYIGSGMYLTLAEAEQNRTLETLKDTDGAYNSYHIFELEFPNPIS